MIDLCLLTQKNQTLQGVIGQNIALWQNLWVGVGRFERRSSARRLRSAAGSINSGRHILESRCAERCANDAFSTSFQATLIKVQMVARNEVQNASVAQRSAHRDSRIWRPELIEPAAERKRRARGRRPTFKSAYPDPQILPQCNISSNYPP